MKGGHNIPEDVIERRYTRELKNLIHLYIPLVNYWMLFNNTEKAIIIAEGNSALDFQVNNADIWNRIKNG